MLYSLMKPKRSILVQYFVSVCLGIFIMQLFSCKKDKPGDGGGGGSNEFLSFPSKVGNSWKYYTLLELFDTTGKLTYKEQYHHYWSVEKDTILLGEKAFKMKFIDSSFNNTIITNYVYYVQKGSGLYTIAIQQSRGSYFHLKRAENKPFCMFTLSDGYGKKGGVLILDSASCILKYPLKLNESWSSNGGGIGVDWYKFVSKESVVTPAGVFSCNKIKNWREGLTLPDERDLFYYYGSKGLIQYTENADLNDLSGGSPLTLVRKTQLISTNF